MRWQQDLAGGMRPFGHGLVVRNSRIDPARAGRRLFFFPERGLRLEPVDEEVTGLEGSLAVRRGGERGTEMIADEVALFLRGPILRGEADYARRNQRPVAASKLPVDSARR